MRNVHLVDFLVKIALNAEENYKTCIGKCFFVFLSKVVTYVTELRLHLHGCYLNCIQSVKCHEAG